MTRLLINIDHVATLRNARREAFPDPVLAAQTCEMAGADGIVFHLREDRRHITDRDVERLKESVRTKLDFELSLAPEIVAICCKTRPQLATLVPERREEVTTEGGLDVIRHRRAIAAVVARLRDAGVQEVALFVDPLADMIDAAAETGASAIELHTGDYANAATSQQRHEVLAQLSLAAERADRNGLYVHAGHGLDYHNILPFRTAVAPLREVSIGFAIIARSVFVGLDQAVRDMAALLRQPLS